MKSRVHKFSFIRLIYAMHGKNVLGEIDSDGDNGHDFPFQVS